MPDLVERLERVTRRRLLERLPTDPSGDLERRDLRDLLLIYGNWRHRLVSAQPREVHVSSKLKRSADWKRHADALDAITNAVAAGDDVTPYLSTGVRTAHVPDAQAQGVALKRRRDLDLLISDWGVHHLHLGTAPHPPDPSFMARTDDLLFAVFEPADAYFIGIYRHGEWAPRDVLETIVRCWPTAQLLQRSLSGVRLAQPADAGAHQALREAGVAQPVEIDGAVYMPPSPTAAGTPGTVSRHVMRLTADFEAWRPDALQRLRQVAGVGPGAYWIPEVDGDLCGFAAEGAFIPVGRLVPAGRFG